MFDSIKRDTDKARKADGGSFITQTGEYVVWIGQAAAKQTASGASLIEFTLKDVRTSALCTTRLVLTKASGDEAFGMGMLHALMTILNIDEIKTQAATVYRRDHTTEQGYRIPALEKKQVGVLLQRVNDVYQGREKFDMSISGFFDPVTRKTASEIINGVETPVKLEQKLKGLKDRDTDDYKAFHAAPQNGAQPEVPPGYGQEAPNYDPPF